MNISVALEEIADIRLGMPFKTAVNDLGEQGECYLIQTKDIDLEGLIRMENLAKVSPESNPEKHYLHNGDILLRLRGPVFSAGIFNDSTNILPAITSNQNAVVTCRRDIISPSYLHWYINSHAGQAYFNNMSEGTNISKVSLKMVSKMNIEIPPLIIQKRISEIKNNWLHQKNIYRNLIVNGDSLFEGVCEKILREGV